MIHRLFILAEDHGPARDWAVYLTREKAEEKGAEWVGRHPQDIVMLVDLMAATCLHCGRAIQEQAGWVVHRWIHAATGAYTCWNNDFTQAEPKENV